MLLAIGCLLVNFLLIYVAFGFVRPAGGRDNSKPRAQSLEGLSHRAWSAHQNQLEVFPPFAAAIFAALYCGVSLAWTGGLALAFTLLRIAFLWAYLNNKPSLRSSLFGLGFFCVVALFVLSLIHLARGAL